MAYMSILQELFNSRHTVSRIDIIMYFNHLHQVHRTFSIWNALRSKLITCCILGICINSPWLLQNETHCVSNWYLAENKLDASILYDFSNLRRTASRNDMLMGHKYMSRFWLFSQLVTHCVTNWFGRITASSCGWQMNRFFQIRHTVCLKLVRLGRIDASTLNAWWYQF